MNNDFIECLCSINGDCMVFINTTPFNINDVYIKGVVLFVVKENKTYEYKIHLDIFKILKKKKILTVDEVKFVNNNYKPIKENVLTDISKKK